MKDVCLSLMGLMLSEWIKLIIPQGEHHVYL
jgi:hypothetical protein